MLAYPDGTMGLMVDGVSAQSGLNELITLADNRDFTSDTVFWTKGATTTISGGTASVASAGNEVMLFRVNLATAHKLYLATYTIVSVTGQIRVQQGSGTTTIHSTAGTYSDYMSITLNTDGNVSWHSIGAITASIDNISYKEVYNNTTNATMPVFGTTIEIGSFNGGTNAFAVLSDVRIGGI
jgi:hypothetical protein